MTSINNIVKPDAILWDFDGTLANSAAKNIAITRQILARVAPRLTGSNLPRYLQNEADYHFANHNADILNAFLGRGLYSKMGPQPVRTVMAGHDYMFMFWTIPGKGIKSISDLKGKIGYIRFKANPMFDAMAKNQLASAGMTTKDLKAVLAFSSITAKR